jgi:hypothetical protein
MEGTQEKRGKVEREKERRRESERERERERERGDTTSDKSTGSCTFGSSSNSDETQSQPVYAMAKVAKSSRDWFWSAAN